jgi:hypothetical protein
LPWLLAWYDRDAAAAPFEPVRALMEQADNSELVAQLTGYLSWGKIDPHAAVAKLEQLRPTTDADTRALIRLKETVGMNLALPREDRWRLDWHRYEYGTMRFPLERDVW